MYYFVGYFNIVVIKGVYEDEMMVYLVMEFCEGGEFFDCIIERGMYIEVKVVDLICMIVGVVEVCYNLGVVYCDLKFENFLFQIKYEDLMLKVVDFGFFWFFELGDVFIEIVGSLFYVVFEVLDCYYGLEVDIWSVGVILYILLSGVLFFWVEIVQGIFEEVMKGELLSFVVDLWLNIFEGVKDLIWQMLNFDL